MDATAYLIFFLHGSTYAAKAAIVREILPLPELTPIEEAPPYVTGVFNLRGRIVPVLDLDIRFGHQPARYGTGDAVIVLEADGRLAGVIVNEAVDVRSIPAKDIEIAQDYLRERGPHPRFLEGEAKVDGMIIMILNLSSVIMESEALGGNDGAVAPQARHSFIADATPEEQAVFKARAQSLKESLLAAQPAGLVPLAVVGISGEYFGFDAALAREFTVISGLTPIPGVPPHVAGCVNLHGNVLAVVDLRRMLNLAVNGASAQAKAVVADADGVTAGIAVDEVYDVVYVSRDAITAVPSAVMRQKDCVKGTAPYGVGMLTVLDLKKILQSEAIIVNEEA